MANQPNTKTTKATKAKATKAKATKAAKDSKVVDAKATEELHQEDLRQRNLEPELATEPVAGLSQTEQEDYDAGQEAAKRGLPERTCPHDGGPAKAAWLLGYHAFAHPPSTTSVVPGEDGQEAAGPYRGKY